jgi:hypothetical protein
MKTNPDKFQAIAIGPKTNRHNLSFDLKGNKITCEENAKLLGVTVDSQLNFDKQIPVGADKTTFRVELPEVT